MLFSDITRAVAKQLRAGLYFLSWTMPLLTSLSGFAGAICIELESELWVF